MTTTAQRVAVVNILKYNFKESVIRGVLQGVFWGAMHGPLQGELREVCKGALQEALSLNKRVPNGKKKRKWHNTKKRLWPPTCRPPTLWPPFAFPFRPPQGALINGKKNGSLSSYEANAQITTLIPGEFWVDPLYKIMILTYKMSQINCTTLFPLFQKPFSFLWQASQFKPQET